MKREELTGNASLLAAMLLQRCTQSTMFIGLQPVRIDWLDIDMVMGRSMVESVACREMAALIGGKLDEAINTIRERHQHFHVLGISAFTDGSRMWGGENTLVATIRYVGTSESRTESIRDRDRQWRDALAKACRRHYAPSVGSPYFVKESKAQLSETPDSVADVLDRLMPRVSERATRAMRRGLREVIAETRSATPASE